MKLKSLFPLLLLSFFSFFNKVFPQSTKQIYLEKYAQTVPIGKVWYINNTKEFEMNLGDGIKTSGTACNAAFHSNPSFIPAISYIEANNSITHDLLFTFKDVKTIDDIVFKIKPMFFFDDVREIIETLNWTMKPQDICFYPGTSVWLNSCLNKMVIYERDLKPDERGLFTHTFIENNKQNKVVDKVIVPEVKQDQENTLILDEANNFSNDMALIAMMINREFGPVKKYGYLDKNGDLVVFPVFEKANPFKEGYALVSQSYSTGFYFIGKDGLKLFNQTFSDGRSFSEGFAAVQNYNEGWGFINKKGVKITTTRYEQVGDFIEGMASVKFDNKWGFIDTTGKEVIYPQFTEVRNFSEGLAMTRLRLNYQFSEYKYIDKSGNVVLKLLEKQTPVFSYQYDSNSDLSLCDFHNGQAIVNVGQVYGSLAFSGIAAINTSGKIVVKGRGNLYPVGEGIYLDVNHGQKSLINENGKRIDLSVYNQIASFKEGLAMVSINDNCGYIDKTGKVVINQDILKPQSYVIKAPHFDEASDFREGLARVKVRGLYGYIDTAGNWVIKPCLQSARLFLNGIAVVKFPNMQGWTYIDKTGAILYSKFK